MKRDKISKSMYFTILLRFQTEKSGFSQNSSLGRVYHERRKSGLTACTQRMSDSQRKLIPANTLLSQISTEPDSPSLCGLISTGNKPLGTGPFQALGDDLFAATFHRTAANHVSWSAKQVISHALGVVAETGCRLACFLRMGSQFLTSPNDKGGITFP